MSGGSERARERERVRNGHSNTPPSKTRRVEHAGEGYMGSRSVCGGVDLYLRKHIQGGDFPCPLLRGKSASSNGQPFRPQSEQLACLGCFRSMNGATRPPTE